MVTVPSSSLNPENSCSCLMMRCIRLHYDHKWPSKAFSPWFIPLYLISPSSSFVWTKAGLGRGSAATSAAFLIISSTRNIYEGMNLDMHTDIQLNSIFSDQLFHDEWARPFSRKQLHLLIHITFICLYCLCETHLRSNFKGESLISLRIFHRSTIFCHFEWVLCIFQTCF